MAPQQIKIAVKQLVEFVLRGGSIDNRFAGSNRATEGSRIHRRLQKAEGDSYQAEVFLSIESEYESYVVTVEGRADGIIITEDGVIIDEIKSTGVPLAFINEDFNRAHWAQAICYGYIYCLQNRLEQIGVRLTYYHVETEEIKQFHKTYSLEEVTTFYFDLLAKYKKWADYKTQWVATRDASIGTLPFPFPDYRLGQRQFAVAVYKTIASSGMLFAQAPTGIGKTMSTLYPSVKALGEGEVEKIFYLTAKTITRQVAEDAVNRMHLQGLRLKTVTLTAKDKICFLSERNCNPDRCIYAHGHFDRVNDAMYELLQNCDNFSREIITEYAQKYTVCPFELALDVTMWSDCIICDYNYLFDPQVHLKRFFSSKGEYAFLVDEAHNLVNRAREMFSARLSKSAFLQARRTLGKQEKSLYRILGKINTAMVEMRKLCETDDVLVSKEAPLAFTKLLHLFIPSCEEWLKLHQGMEVDPNVLQLYFDTLSFVKIMDLYDERYVTFLRKEKSELHVTLFCLDPSHLLRQCMKKGKATVLFSATLTPASYFSAVLGGDEESRKLILPSPFPQEHLSLLIADDISTKYRNREHSIEDVAEMIFQTVRGKVGNYLVYLPSYKYLNDVYRVFVQLYPQIHVQIQHSKMGEQAREDFLSSFDDANSQTLIGFCVLGGIYAEGINLKGERLIGTIIVGVGLPQLNPEHNIIRDYYNQRNNMGYEYAYLYPGMNKILQAAGRVIRDEHDRGVVVLIDERFTTGTYRSLFPSHWQHYQVVRTPHALATHIQDFW
ncbi:MAG: ATP-dependent DNA helicase [Firmicutes bacterium]|nr:ATP-dependent DNA helicase [Bacillota bacterium]